MGAGRSDTRAAIPAPTSTRRSNPLLGYRERFVRTGPSRRRPDDADELFADGWRHAALDSVAIGGVQPTLLDAAEPGGARAVRGARGRAAASRRVPAGARGSGRRMARRDRWRGAPCRSSGVIDYARCPKRFYWTAVRPLPRFSGPAARIGTEVHRWIERRASGQAVLLEVDETPDLTSEELAGEPGKVERLREAFLGSRFADVTPLYAERPFLLRLEGFTVGGRIDAVYGEPDGPWEVVDWKTGRRPPTTIRSPRCSSTSTAWRASRSGASAPTDADAHLPLPGERRGGVAPDGGSRRGNRDRVVGTLAIDRRRCVRPDTGTAMHVLRLPRVLCGGQGVADRETADARRYVVSRSICSLERPVAGRRIEPALGDTGDEARRQAGLRRDARLDDGAEPLEARPAGSGPRRTSRAAGTTHRRSRRASDGTTFWSDAQTDVVVVSMTDAAAASHETVATTASGSSGRWSSTFIGWKATRRASGRAGGRFEPCPREARA